MAGNIIPAIATANAIVAGLAVLRAQAILKGHLASCSSVYLRPKVNHRGQLFVPDQSKQCTGRRRIPIAYFLPL